MNTLWITETIKIHCGNNSKAITKPSICEGYVYIYISAYVSIHICFYYCNFKGKHLQHIPINLFSALAKSVVKLDISSLFILLFQQQHLSIKKKLTKNVFKENYFKVNPQNK